MKPLADLFTKLCKSIDREHAEEYDDEIQLAYNQWLGGLSREESRAVDDWDGFKAGYIFKRGK